jgi:hypothetical protein
MHLRGKDATTEVKYPDGREETLLRVPKYDFNWQIVYCQKTPLGLPPGTELHLTGHWDNSPANKWNPDPTAAVPIRAFAESQDLATLTLRQASELIRRREVSAVELTEACLRRIDTYNRL